MVSSHADRVVNLAAPANGWRSLPNRLASFLRPSSVLPRFLPFPLRREIIAIILLAAFYGSGCTTMLLLYRARPSPFFPYPPSGAASHLWDLRSCEECRCIDVVIRYMNRIDRTVSHFLAKPFIVARLGAFLFLIFTLAGELGSCSMGQY